MLMNVSSLCRSLLIAFPEKLPCAYLIAERMFSPFTSYATRYMTCVLAVDRYMRIKYLQDYQVKFSTFWYRMVLGIYITSVLFISLCYLLPNMFNQPEWIPRLTAPLNVIGLIIFLTFYTKSYIILKQHMESSRNLSTTNQDLVKITRFYLIFYIISNLLVLGTSFASSQINSQNGKLMKQDTAVLFLLANNLNNILTGIVTSLSTLIINRATKAKLSTYINSVRRHLRPYQWNQVLPRV